MNIRALSVVFALASGGAIANDVPAADTGEYVSIIQLIANPDRYHGKVVFLSVYPKVEFEGDCLCMVPNAASSKDCLWLQYDDGPWETDKDMERYKRAQARWKPLSGKRVSVRGTFNKNNTGHFGLFSGALEKIADVYPHSRRK